jgi:hypothetical protein
MSDNKYPQESAFGFLDEIKTQFMMAHNAKEIESALSFSFNAAFSPVIKKKMEYYNKNVNHGDALSRLKKGVMEQHGMLMQTTETLTERGEKINLVVKKAETLRKESESFYGNVF